MHEDFPEIHSGLLDRWQGLLRNYADLLQLSAARVLRLQDGAWSLMAAAGPAADRQIGRASCRERVSFLV